MARHKRRSAREKQAELEREAATPARASGNPYLVDVIRAARAASTFEPIADAEGLARALNSRRSEGYRPERLLILRNNDILVVFIRVGG